VQNSAAGRFSFWALGLFIAVGLIALGGLLGGAIMRFRSSGRYVTANQGSFQLLNYDKGDSTDGFNEFKSPKKLVRVVSTIDYFLVD
jgi:hypothetical protein